MKRFRVTETKMMPVTWVYEVEAEDENEALELAIESIPIHMEIGEDIPDPDDSEWEVIDEE